MKPSLRKKEGGLHINPVSLKSPKCICLNVTITPPKYNYCTATRNSSSRERGLAPEDTQVDDSKKHTVLANLKSF